MIKITLSLLLLATSISFAGDGPHLPWQFYGYYQPNLPYHSYDGTYLWCDSSGLYGVPPNGQTEPLAGTCPTKFYGYAKSAIAQFNNGLWSLEFGGKQTRLAEVEPKAMHCVEPIGTVATFGNGLFYFDSAGAVKRLSEAAPALVHGCVTDGVVANYANGLYLLKYDATFKQLATVIPAQMIGHNSTGVFGHFGNGFYFLRYDGTFVRLSEALPASVVYINDSIARACYANGLYEFDLQGAYKQIAPSCVWAAGMGSEFTPAAQVSPVN